MCRRYQPYLIDCTVQVHSGSRLCMHTDDVASSLGKVCYPLLRMHNHLQLSSNVVFRMKVLHMGKACKR